MTKLPNRNTRAWKIINSLYEFGGTMTLDMLAEINPTISRRTITGIASIHGLQTERTGCYELPKILQKLMDYCVPGEDSEKAPIVPHRVIDVINRPAWKCNLNPRGNRDDAGPAHDISHYTGGTAAEPKINGFSVGG